MNKTLLITLSIAAFIVVVNGHARLLDPISRASAWRKFPDIFPKYFHDHHWCEIRDKKGNLVEPNDRDVKCGIAGPVYANGNNGPTSVYMKGQKRYRDVYSFEQGATYYRGNIVKTYKKGELIDVNILVAANHGGDIQFRLCKRGSDGKDPEKSCFDKEENHLSFNMRNGKKEIPLNSIEPTIKYYGRAKMEEFIYKVQLPEDFTCEHCIFQFYWHNTQPGQVYVYASDIKIVE